MVLEERKFWTRRSITLYLKPTLLLAFHLVNQYILFIVGQFGLVNLILAA